MGIVFDSGLNGYQPICDDCGIALCYDINKFEYLDHKEFWDNWVCDRCNPNYLRAYRTKILKLEKIIN
jgi:hypothetical protein